jgi:DNA (cytosine-5)-methyltransferase 1
MALHVLSLFAGIGGFDLGLERTGSFDVIAQSEIGILQQRVLRKHWPHVRQLEDIRSVGPKQVAELGAVDVITAGFPCQDISLAGDGSGLSGPRSGLFWELARTIRLVRPAIVLLENVAALLGRGMGAVLGTLAQEGYDTEWDCLRAIDAGRPHVRDRIYIAANASGLGWGSGRPWGLADGLAGIPVEPCWSGDPVAFFEERFSQSALLGMDDGLPRGLDRIGAAGNSMIPIIPELIGRALLREGALA